MWVGRAAMMIVLASTVSGCAGGRTRQDMARLQSQVGLLDERVSQLERSGLGATVSFSEPAQSTGPAVSDAGSTRVQPAARKRTAKKVAGGSATASLKPSTREIQQALKNAGFYQGSLDGKMGPMTRDAVKEFQRVHGLKDDGVVGKQTWGKLQEYADLSASGGEATAAESLK